MRTDFNIEEKLLKVAGQCVHEGCEAVLLSRALLMTKYDYVWDDNLLCGSSYSYRVNPYTKTIKKNNKINIADNILKIKPNPAKDEFTIQLLLNEIPDNSKVEIYNLVGQLIETRTINKETINLKFNVRDWTGGMYYCKVVLSNGKTITKKITIVR